MTVPDQERVAVDVGSVNAVESWIAVSGEGVAKPVLAKSRQSSGSGCVRVSIDAGRVYDEVGPIEARRSVSFHAKQEPAPRASAGVPFVEPSASDVCHALAFADRCRELGQAGKGDEIALDQLSRGQERGIGWEWGARGAKPL